MHDRVSVISVDKDFEKMLVINVLNIIYVLFCRATRERRWVARARKCLCQKGKICVAISPAALHFDRKYVQV